MATTDTRKDDAVPAGVRAAWDEYLEATRGQNARADFPGNLTQYESIEPYAWERLKARLRKIGHRLDGNERLV